jgi:hypothetical protein
MRAANSRTIELWVLSVEGQLGHEVVYVFRDERRISTHALALRRASGQALEPAGVGLRLPEHDRVALLEHFVDGDEGFECLDFIGENWLSVVPLALSTGLRLVESRSHAVGVHLHLHALPEARRALVVPCVHDACSHVLACAIVSFRRAAS